MGQIDVVLSSVLAVGASQVIARQDGFVTEVLLSTLLLSLLRLAAAEGRPLGFHDGG